MRRDWGTKVLIVAVAAAGLGGCETLRGRRPVEAAPQPPMLIVRPPEVVQVQPPPARTIPPPARSCVPRGLAAAPRYPDTDAALRNAPGAADRYQLMAAGRLLRQKRLDELERVIAGCR